MVDSLSLIQAGTLSLDGLQTLGVSLLSKALQEAYVIFTSANIRSDIYERHSIRNSVLFIQGSGLEFVIETFGLEYDPNVLRENFFDLCYQNIKKPQR